MLEQPEQTLLERPLAVAEPNGAGAGEAGPRLTRRATYFIEPDPDFIEPDPDFIEPEPDFIEPDPVLWDAGLLAVELELPISIAPIDGDPGMKIE
jgi:hypothetical protein